MQHRAKVADHFPSDVLCGCVSPLSVLKIAFVSVQIVCVTNHRDCALIEKGDTSIVSIYNIASPLFAPCITLDGHGYHTLLQSKFTSQKSAIPSQSSE